MGSEECHWKNAKDEKNDKDDWLAEKNLYLEWKFYLFPPFFYYFILGKKKFNCYCGY